jgi:hypothetical protein
MKKTKWFDGSKFVPAHAGVYEVKSGSTSISYQYWNGKFWAARTSSNHSAYLNQSWESCFKSPTWRGLTKKASS